jgi:hypothetical protein
MARKYSGPSLEEILADLEDAAERSKEKYKEKYAEYSEPSPRHSEAYLLKIVSILIWLAGIGSCAVLAWWGSGRSELLTSITLLLPLLAWHIFGLWSWMLLLPISLRESLPYRAQSCWCNAVRRMVKHARYQS